MPDKNCLSSVGLCIGLPFIGRPISPAWALSFASQNYPMNIHRGVSCLQGEEIGSARNKMVHSARSHGSRYLWFLDDDVAPPFHAIRSLITTLENAPRDVMVAAGIYCAKTLPTEPVVFRGNGVGAFWRWKHGDVFECTGIGTGCMLIKTELFDLLPEPWFKTIDTEGTPEQPVLQETDDMYFCDRVIEAGYKILADTNVMCIHWDYDQKKKEFVPYILPADSYPMRPPTEEEPRANRHMYADTYEEFRSLSCAEGCTCAEGNHAVGSGDVEVGAGTTPLGFKNRAESQEPGASCCDHVVGETGGESWQIGVCCD